MCQEDEKSQWLLIAFRRTASGVQLSGEYLACLVRGTALQAEVGGCASNPAASSPSSSMQPVTDPSGVVPSRHDRDRPQTLH